MIERTFQLPLGYELICSWDGHQIQMEWEPELPDDGQLPEGMTPEMAEQVNKEFRVARDSFLREICAKEGIKIGIGDEHGNIHETISRDN